MKAKLDRFERNIERDAAAYRSATTRERARIDGLVERIRKTRNINIRISEGVLDRLKKLSAREGIPYQTLISSVLHKFVTNQLVDESAIRRTLELLRPPQRT